MANAEVVLQIIERGGLYSNLYQMKTVIANYTPQWGAADAEIKVPSGENTELKRSPFKA